MSGTERSRRLKARQAHEAASTANGTQPAGRPSAPAVAAARPFSASVLDVGLGEPDAVAARILDAVPPERAMLITTALHRRYMMGGSWPHWMAPIVS